MQGTGIVGTATDTKNNSKLGDQDDQHNISSMLSSKQDEPKKVVGAKDEKMNAINSYRVQLEDQKERFKDVRIPADFRAKYELDTKM